MPPRQCTTTSCSSAAGYGTRITPKERLLETWLPLTMSLRPPEMTTPLPTGPASAEPVVGTFGLLLSCTVFFVNSQQECVPVGPIPPLGQAPSCGEGASSLFWLLVTKPDWLLSN